MIDYADLSIHDLIYDPVKEQAGYLFQISNSHEIYYLPSRYYRAKADLNNPFRLEICLNTDIEDVQITDDALKTAGFKHITHEQDPGGWRYDDVFCKYIDGFKLYLWETKNKGRWHIKIVSDVKIINIPVQSIREIQHALRLGGLGEIADKF